MNADELKNKIEAILFASGKKVAVEYMCKLTRANKEEVVSALQQLKKDYEAKNTSLIIADEGEFWKIYVRETYSTIVRKIVPETELTKTMIETLAVIAWKAPVLQSDVIRVRTNKAYDHMTELEDSGFISREKHGRTHLVKLTQRFYNYFDVHNEAEVKDKFKGFKEEAEKEMAEHEKAGKEEHQPKVDEQKILQPEAKPAEKTGEPRNEETNNASQNTSSEVPKV